MRKFLLGVLGLAAIGAATLPPAEAQAQGVTITIGNSGYGAYRLYPAYGPRPVYYGRPAYGYHHHHHPRWARPVPVRYGWRHHGYGPRCVVRVNRYFNGYTWVKSRRRVCY